jgi:hypothetical protein
MQPKDSEDGSTANVSPTAMSAPLLASAFAQWSPVHTCYAQRVIVVLIALLFKWSL